MQIIVINGPMSEREQDAYIRHVTKKYPMSAIEKLFLEVHEDYVDVRYTLHRSRELHFHHHYFQQIMLFQVFLQKNRIQIIHLIRLLLLYHIHQYLHHP